MAGFMVVRLIISGSFSPSPLERWMVYLALPICSRNFFFLFGVGEIGLAFRVDLMLQGRLGDEHLADLDQRGVSR